ncbi:MAG: hypothetical protein HY934_04305 [Candidatus Firestonebacteria bacterium]|nr:hypothetical protein [Candidatus Firestonebacteria bacterium]
MEEAHTESHGESHHEVIEHHEPAFRVKVLTWIWTCAIAYTLLNLFVLIGNHIIHELLAEITEFLSH